MNIAQTSASKAIVAVVAAAMIFSAFAAPVKAQTTEELQAQIAELMAQIAALSGSTTTTTTTTTVSSTACPYVWTRDLSQGSTGADVMKLQQFLNSDADTRVAVAGAGSAGMETDYYGAATAGAVSKFQVKYRAEVLTPSGLVNPTGFFGPSTRAQANKLCVAAVVDGEDEDDEDADSEDAELSGEGELDTFEVDDAEDEVQEGASDEIVAELTLEATDGDIELDRMTFTLVEAVADANEEADPWDVFEEVTLWVDDEMVAEFDASDEDNYLDEDDGEFRFSGLGLVLMEDEESVVSVAVSVAGSVDGSETDGAAAWELTAVSARSFDADGVASDDDDVDQMGDSVTFDIVEEGADDDVSIESNSSNPAASTLMVEEDGGDSEEFTVFTFDIEVDEDSSDIELGDALLDVTVNNASSTGTLVGGIETVLSEINMTIDGETQEGDAVDSNDYDNNIAASGSNTTAMTFDFDGTTLKAGETYEVEVTMVFNGQDGEYDNGDVTVEVAVTGSQWDAEGASDDNLLDGSETSEEHTLSTVVPVITEVEDSVTVDDPNDSGRISFTFTVAADEDDVTLAVADNSDVDGSTDDVKFTLSGTDTSIAVASLTKVGGDATYGSGVWTIDEGDDADFALDITFTTASSADDGTYYATLESIGGVEVDETSSGLGLSF